MGTFIHLHLHTEYSIVDGMVRIKPLIEAVKANQMPAVAITDQMNVFAMVKFYQAALAAGIKPIIGADLVIESDSAQKKPCHLVVLCQNETGYRQLCQLLSKGYLEGQRSGTPYLKREWVAGHSEGLIALSGGREGDIGQALLNDQTDLAEARVEFWKEAFPNRFYIELQRTDRQGEGYYTTAAVALAQSFQLPVVATNDVRFLQAEDYEAHEARTCIHEGWVLQDTSRPQTYSEAQYFRSAQAMNDLFADLPEAIENTYFIAQRCNFQLNLGEYHLPQFPIPQNNGIADYLKQQAEAGLEKRLQHTFDPQDQSFELKRQPYDERLARELDVIIEMGFPGYFLIVADFIQWAKDQGIPVGPGRGSGAGSLVAYALEITNLDPIALDLLFERFLNPERVSLPDFDVDFCMESRDRVIDYVADKYGRENVSQIITYGTMAARAVVRDVGRVLGHPYGFVDRIAKLIPFELGMTLEKALTQEDELARLYQEEEEVNTLIHLALKLEGLTRNAGKHAGGVVIAPRPLTDYAPLYCEEDGEGVVTQFDKDDVEAIGLVKFDFLGLRTLTIINWACQHINQKRAREGQTLIDINQIPLNDQATFELLCRCETTAVFQLESRGMKDLIRRLQPDTFDEVIALVALFRPGPLQSGMVDDFINRKHGRAQVAYPHDALAPILKPTYGVILYQEQVMQIAQKMAGYTLGHADLLRRAMGKKKQKEMAEQRSIFIEGAKARGFDAPTAEYVFDLIEKFAGYGFNKSHSAAYALLAYQTAWLKTHYPAEFMAAVMSSDMDNTDKVVIFVEECQSMGLVLHPPDINQGEYRFTVNEQGEILYGLGAIKGVGYAAIEALFIERQRHGPFSGLFELCRRVDTRKVNRRVLESLIGAGAFDCFGVARSRLMKTVAQALKKAEQQKQSQAVGQGDLFAGVVDEVDQDENYYVCEPWSAKTRLHYEKNTLGLYLTGHPVEHYQEELKSLNLWRLAQLTQESDYTLRIAAMIAQARVLTTKRQDRMAVLRLDDGTAQMEAVAFSDVFNEKRHLLRADQFVIIDGEVTRDDYRGGLKLVVQDLMSIVEFRERTLKALVIPFNLKMPDFIERLKIVLQAYRGGKCPVWIRYTQCDAQTHIALGPAWHVHPKDELIEELSQMTDSVIYQYQSIRRS